MPISCAATSTLACAFLVRVIRAAPPGNVAWGYVALAQPMPVSHSPSRRPPGLGSQSPQPNRSAPIRYASARWREEKGRPDAGSAAGSFRSLSSNRVHADLLGELVDRAFCAATCPRSWPPWTRPR